MCGGFCKRVAKITALAAALTIGVSAAYAAPKPPKEPNPAPVKPAPPKPEPHKPAPGHEKVPPKPAPRG